MPSRASRIITDTLFLAAVAAGFAVYFYHQQLYDWWYLRSYVPPTAISQLADQAQMSQKARDIFYVTGPKLDNDRKSIVADCNITDNQVYELGCYSSQNRIFLLNITNPKLTSEMPVTAAHEMLHAAYARLSDSQKQQLTPQLEAAATTAEASDPDLKKQVELYKRDEPDQVDNELHSLLGTEVADLPPALEQYYSQYFTNRAQVVAYNSQFNQVFDSLKAQIDTMGTQIDTLRGQLTAMKSVMQSYLNRGDIPAYNADVPVYNDKVSQLNNLVNQYNSDVSEYNQYSMDLLSPQQTTATSG